jgi:enoyl-CoA hydratase
VATVAVEPAGDAVRVIRLDRPERLNAITFELVGDLHDALDTVAADERCKVAVLTGAGRGFCAGLDLKDFGTPPAAGEHPHFPAGTTGQSFMANLTQHIRATPQIVVAAVNGPAFGGGLSLSLACGRGSAALGASCSAFSRTGLHRHRHRRHLPAPRLIGASRAFDLIVTGRTVDAARPNGSGSCRRCSTTTASSTPCSGGRRHRRLHRRRLA